ncbi:MAG TPA: DsrE family protein [Burkholderiaceae bacterium]
MKTPTRRLFGLLGATTVVAALTPSIASAQTQAPAKKDKVVFQMSDNDPAKWGLALNNMRNVQVMLGDEDVDVELVAFGPGIAMLKGDSPMAKRITEALKHGAKVVACENTMKAQKLVYADMLPDIGYVPGGVVELMRKQQQGYAYIKP